MDSVPTKKDLEAAFDRTAPLVHHTPVLQSQTINSILDCKVFFKCENFQKVGAFKFRGAINVLLSLPERQLKNGVATHSSGNHAQALALAAKMRKTQAFIVMPSNAPSIKNLAVQGYGAEIIECDPTQESREKALAQTVEKTGAHFIHPYNNYGIIAGQATCAKEFITTQPDLDYIVAPVGGGGLLSGTALSAHYYSPKTQVIGAEPAGADDACRSLQEKHIVPSINPQTIADGLLTSLGDKTFPIIRKYVSDIFTVDDRTIVYCMKLLMERMKIIVEPSAAVALAVVISNKRIFRRKRVGVILSGGNIDLLKIPELFALL